MLRIELTLSRESDNVGLWIMQSPLPLDVGKDCPVSPTEVTRWAVPGLCAVRLDGDRFAVDGTPRLLPWRC